jgi:phosphoribosylformimino-5-aminoimidazole carboxamide ribotide isomerase
MLAIPSVTLRDGQCASSAAGEAGSEGVQLDDPLFAARRWIAAGFARLQILDLDAASGRGENRSVIRELIRQIPVPLLVVGGLREAESLAELLDEGAESVVVGSRGVEDPGWLEEQSWQATGRLILSVELRGRRVMTRGRSHEARRDVLDLIAELEPLPLGGLLITPVWHDGPLSSTDLALYEDVARAAPWPVIAGSGAGSMLDLHNLAERDLWAALIGTTLFTDAFDPRVVAEEFAT